MKMNNMNQIKFKKQILMQNRKGKLLIIKIDRNKY